MSLVVLSNIQGEYQVENGRDGDDRIIYNSAKGLSKPYSYQNHINPPMKIPANSEVALQSIKLNRSGNYTITENKTFAFYCGEEIQHDHNDGTNASDGATYQQRSLSGQEDDTKYTGTTSMPQIIRIKAGTYTPSQFANHLTSAFHNGVGHPDMYLTSKVTELDDADENGTGFTFGFTWQGDQTDTDRTDGTELPLPDGVIGRIDGLSISNESGGGSGTDLRYDPDESKLTAHGGTDNSFDNGSAILTTYPLSLFSGEVIYNVSDCKDIGWRVGLVRPCQTDGREKPLYHSGSPVDFYDYLVEWSQEVGETEKTIKLKHMVWESQAGDGTIMKSIDYYESGLTGVSTDQITATFLTGVGAGVHIIRVSMIAQGENLKVELTDSAGNTYVVNDTANAFDNGETILKDKSFKPIGQTCWALYPAIGIPGHNKHIKVDKLGGLMNGVYPPATAHEPITLPNWNSPTRTADALYYPYPQKADLTTAQPQTTGQSYYMRSFVEEQARVGCRNIDSRSCYVSDDGISQKDYVGVDKLGEGVEQQGIQMIWGIITKPSQHGYDTSVKGSYTAPFIDDVGDLLGLTGTDAYTSTWMGSLYYTDDADTEYYFIESGGLFTWWIMPSFSRPTITSGSLFVRCPTLTHQSFNMGKGIPSKIIYQIPRFSVADNNAGRVGSGELYFEPATMTYLDLNNPAPLNFNDLTLEIVDKNEQYAKDLTGATTIVLHFREKNSKK